MEQHLSQYRIFYEVARAGNISKAAKELFISQPAISKSISKLEENLEVTLFSRNSRGVCLTAEGRILYEHIASAFASIQNGEDQIRKIKELNIGTIRIGASTTLCKEILLPYLRDFVEAYPHVTVTISSRSSSETAQMLEQGSLDLGLIAAPSVSKNMAFKPILDIHDIFVAAPEYLERLNIREGRQYRIEECAHFMLLDKANSSRQYINSHLQNRQIKLRDSIEVNNMDLLIEFAKIGLGLACVIKEFVKEELETGRLTEVKLLGDIPKRSVGFAYMQNNPNPVLPKFLAARRH